MLPLVIVGILTLSVPGLTLPPCELEQEIEENPINQNAEAINSLVTGASSVSTSFTSQNNLALNPQDFWWMSANSPLKQSYDYFKRCSEKGNCFPVEEKPGGCGGGCGETSATFSTSSSSSSSSASEIDLSSNPFFNGQFKGVSFSNCAGAACAGGKPQTVVTSCEGQQCQTTNIEGASQIDLSKNPFFTGKVTGSSSFGQSSSGIPFLSGSQNLLTTGNGAKPQTVVTSCEEQRCQTSTLEGASQIDLSKNPFFIGKVTGSSSFNQQSSAFDLNKNPFLTGSKNLVTTGNGEQITTAPEGFLGVQPAEPFGGKPNPFATSPPTGSNLGVACRGKDYICVLKNQCQNGVVSTGDGLLQVRTDKVEYCDSATQACCRLTKLFATNIQESLEGLDATTNGFSQITVGKSSVPGVKTTGGLIHVLPKGDNLKPIIQSAGESGAGYNVISTTTVKPVRNVSPNAIFPSTVDYSDVSFNDVHFASTLTGLDYLPPRGSTTPPPTGPIYIPPPQYNSESSNKYEYSTLFTTKPTPIPGDQLTGEPNNPSVVSVSSSTPGPSVTPGPTFTPIPEQPPIYSGCAAALNCVQEIYCTAEGVISPVPVVLTKEQQINRVPLAVCTILDTGTEGRCCRDTNYKDPWPSANLINGVDNGQYREDPSLGQYKPQQFSGQKLRPTRSGGRPQLQQFSTGLEPIAQATCGVRNYDTQPKGVDVLDDNFAEIPWQAMVLRDSTRTLLCGGAIIRRNAVITAAHCVDGLDSRDVLIKGGEWKLGIDDEPLPFQIVKVAAIIRHPGYKAGGLQNDVALLVLTEKLRLTLNVGTICLPRPNEIPTNNCIVTGWGKQVLQVHLRNALMHAINVDVISEGQCNQTLGDKYQDSLSNAAPNTLCCQSKDDQCLVDYGSALACSNGDGVYSLSGVFSWDTGCRDGTQIGGYVTPDVDWIESTLTRTIKDLRREERKYLDEHST